MTSIRKIALVALTVVALNACGGSLYYTSDPIEASVVDAETGKPIEGAVVTANWQLVGFSLDTGGTRLGQLEVMETITDQNGRFFFPGFTKLNLSLGELRGDDPRLLIFKSGYEYFAGGHTYPVGKPLPGAHRSSDINGRILRMKRANPDVEKYASNLGFLTTSLMNIVNSGDAHRIPRMIHALACERKRLVAIDPAAGFLSVPGSTGTETNCETK